ncbi:hypothetical protein, partial [Mycobacterium paraseoulense]|uniref:hypothetical protein n=1 Tax=Mycobacterium paraseoulense TaxID=590652 RepID=UPI001B80B6DF
KRNITAHIHFASTDGGGEKHMVATYHIDGRNRHAKHACRNVYYRLQIGNDFWLMQAMVK